MGSSIWSKCLLHVFQASLETGRITSQKPKLKPLIKIPGQDGRFSSRADFMDFMWTLVFVILSYTCA
jgi:hypothetical protein